MTKIEKINKEIRQYHISTGQNKFLNIIDSLIESTIFKKADKNVITIFFNKLGVEHDERSWADIGKLFGSMKKSDCFSSWHTENDVYIFNNPDLKKIKEYKNWLFKQLMQQNTPAQSKRLIEIVKTGNTSRLSIENFNPIEFTDHTCNLLYYFYKADNKSWKTYKDIKRVIPVSTDTIRHTINRINQRVKRATDNQIEILIESKRDDNSEKSPLQYRWAL